MTVGSLFGFQPHPMPPLDEKEFHSYQRERVKLYQDRIFVPQPIPTLTPQVRVIRKVKKKSNSSVKKNGESGNRNRSK